VQQPQPGLALVRRSLHELGEILLSVSGVMKRFGALVAMRDVSLQVKAGEILALLGPICAGKTTMFNLISGVLKVSAGDIQFQGPPR